MKPSKFPQANVILTAPAGMEQECGSLHAFRDGTHHISLWLPTWRERLQVLLKGQVWLWVWSSHTQPPVAVDVADPFRPLTPKKFGWFKRWQLRRACKAAVKEAIHGPVQTQTTAV
jgi:hypothetical protein